MDSFFITTAIIPHFCFVILFVVGITYLLSLKHKSALLALELGQDRYGCGCRRDSFPDLSRRRVCAFDGSVLWEDRFDRHFKAKG